MRVEGDVSPTAIEQSNYQPGLAENKSLKASKRPKREFNGQFRPSAPSRRIKFELRKLRKILTNESVQIELPTRELVHGKIKHRWKSLVHGRRILKTQIELPEGQGIMQISTSKGEPSEVLLLQHKKNKVFRAEIDASGLGSMHEINPNLYFCINHPTNAGTELADENPLPPQIAALTPPLADLQNLQSKPGASKTLYIDYWGGTLTGTAWNSDFNGIYQPFDNNGDSASFSDNERYVMWLGWREAAEDYATFDINVTTSQAVYNSTAAVNRSQIIASPTNFYGGGGIAYVDVFSNSSEFYKTGWASNNSANTLGMTLSHESGHQMGLSHNGVPGDEYYNGHGDWGAIMGAPFGKPYVHWDKGEYNNADNTEDDLDLINLHLNYATDEAGNSKATATNINPPVSNLLGNIEINNLGQDQDFYSFQLDSDTNIRLQVIPALGAEGESRASNLSMRAALIDTLGDADPSNDVVVREIAPSDISPLRPDTNKLEYDALLPAGSYLLSIIPEPADSNWSSGFGNYGNGGQYYVSITSNDFGISDLIVSASGVSAASALPGETVNFTASIQNQGPDESGGTTVSYLLSNDANIDETDTVLRTSSIPNIEASLSENISTSINVDFEIGDYWLGVCIISPANETIDTNNCSAGTPFSVVSPYPNNYAINDNYPYSWTDISDQNDAGLGAVDDAGSEINIGFDFNFYGQTYSNIWVHSNGGMKFGSDIELSFFEYLSIRDAAVPNNFIMPYWDDLNPAAPDSGSIFYTTQGTSPNRRLIVQWNELKHFRESVSGGPQETVTFQAILYETSNDIVIQYQDLSFGPETDNLNYDYGGNAFVAIESPGGYEGLEYLNAGANANSLSDLQAISFYDTAGAHRVLSVGKNIPQGSVIATQGQINCGAQCFGQYALNSTVDLTTSPNAGYEVESWSIPGCGSLNTCEVTMSSHQNVIVNFREIVIDTDTDGVANIDDNCPLIPNADQANNDADAQGDACDLDDDNDSVNDGIDNCPFIANLDQSDSDNDGQGDVCDSDDDNDTINDGTDNCPFISNLSQSDADNDGQGDACDTDDDNDTVEDGADNCPFISNLNQSDADNDGMGDVCDTDDDNDTINDGTDNCPFISNLSQSDADNDGQGDTCDSDDDNDTVEDGADNCPLISNTGQANNDADSQGDACDPDDDNDTIDDGADNCPFISNLNQSDADNDGQGDACDSDDDNDTVDDSTDNCPFISNLDQFDADNDGQGDVCDTDDDNDTINDGTDNCPLISNTDQANNDADSQGDACDSDDDNDTVGDGADNCPLISNTGQANNDADSQGDACDPDDDNDTIDDGADNCPFISNRNQSDADNDGQGDACDSDDDNDTVDDSTDNCPLISNFNQSDSDNDGQGDVCDSDDDNDTVDDGADNCPLISNTDQANNDADSQGDACDSDDDNDTVGDGADNCPLISNTGQANNDADSQGDACDPDDDNDTIDDGADNCPFISNRNQSDADNDGQGDACDSDDDNDTVDDSTDNCPLISNFNQSDSDNDGQGDVCDSDDDNDTVDDGADNCPLISNTDQANNDADSQGDACDSDDDNDTVGDGADNCPFISNLNQSDADNDGQGDVCDTDDDNDTVDDSTDNCPFTSNLNQADADNDGQGNVCDMDDDNDTVDDSTDNCPFTSNLNQSDSDNDGRGDACDTDDDNDTVDDSNDNCPLFQT